MIEYKAQKLLLAALTVAIFMSCAFVCKKVYLAPPQVIKMPDQNHALISRMFQGIPSLAISPEGRLWATWYAGKAPKEDHNNYIVVATSGDGGKTWTESLGIDPDTDGPVRAFDPELWIDPEARLWSFWAQAIGHDGTVAGVWTMINNDPDRSDSEWSQPRRLTDVQTNHIIIRRVDSTRVDLAGH